MAVTAIEVKNEDNISRAKIVTTATDAGLLVEFYGCDEDWHYGDSPPVQYGDTRSEEEYHRFLRINALEKNQFVQSQSTNPEWTPTFKKDEEV